MRSAPSLARPPETSAAAPGSPRSAPKDPLEPLATLPSPTTPTSPAPRAPRPLEPLSLESLYREHFRAVWRVLRRLGVPLAQLDDAAQDVFLVVHRKLDAIDPDSRVRSWIFAVAVRVAWEYRRRAGRQRSEPLADDLVDGAPGPVRQNELREAIAVLEGLLAELDDKKRVVFVLSELEQLSVPEIAEVLGVNVNTVYSRLRSAKRRFDAALARRRAASRSGRSR